MHLIGHAQMHARTKFNQLIYMMNSWSEVPFLFISSIMTFPFQHFVINHKELKLNKSLISQVKNITFFFLMKILKLKKKN